MKKSQFAIIIAVIVLGLGGIFGYVKYRLDSDKQVDNNKTEEKLLTKTELEQKMNELLNSNLNEIEKEWNLNKKITIEDFAGGGYYYNIKYILNNRDLKPSINDGMDGGLSLDFINKTYESKTLDLFKNFELHNLYNNSDEKYLTICENVYLTGGHRRCYVYDLNANEIGQLKISDGSLFTKYSDETTLLSKYSGLTSDYAGRIIYTDKYIMTSYDKDNKHYIYKYTINNNKLNEEVLKIFADEEVTCIQCD